MNKYRIAYMSLIVLFITACTNIKVKDAKSINKLPDIWPDYTDVTIPVNIAPMEFNMKDDNFDAISVIFEGEKDRKMEACGESGIEIDEDDWHELLNNNKDCSLKVTVCARKDGKWMKFLPFNMYVKSDSIDYGIVYRLIAPGYQVYSRMGIYQRSLSDYNQSPIFENTQVTNSCVNCHTFCQGDPNIQSIHMRGKNGATIIVKDGKMCTYNSRTDSTLATAVYPYWHPSGRYIAYSTNIIRQQFHSTASDLMETFDMNSDLYVYDTQKNEIIYNKATQNKDFFETNPAFSPDGKKLYFCRSLKKEMPLQAKEVKYDLCSVEFNPSTGEIGTKIDTLVYATKDSMSVSLPRPSYDGKYIIYALTNYGCFPLYHKESDLWILNLSTGKASKMDEVNSEYADAFHNWSSNNRWIVFGSRRGDGMHTRAYFSYIDKSGKGRKPFLLPQHSPKEYYNDLMLSYNCLEFVKGKVKFNARNAGLALSKKHREKMNIKKNK